MRNLHLRAGDTRLVCRTCPNELPPPITFRNLTFKAPSGAIITSTTGPVQFDIGGKTLTIDRDMIPYVSQYRWGEYVGQIEARWVVWLPRKSTRLLKLSTLVMQKKGRYPRSRAQILFRDSPLDFRLANLRSIDVGELQLTRNWRFMRTDYGRYIAEYKIDNLYLCVRYGNELFALYAARLMHDLMQVPYDNRTMPDSLMNTLSESQRALIKVEVDAKLVAIQATTAARLVWRANADTKN